MILSNSTRPWQPIRSHVYILLCIEGVSLAIGGYFDSRSRFKLGADPLSYVPELNELGAAIAYLLAFCALLTFALPIMLRWLFSVHRDEYKNRRFTILAAGVAMFAFAMALSFAVY